MLDTSETHAHRQVWMGMCLSYPLVYGSLKRILEPSVRWVTEPPVAASGQTSYCKVLCPFKTLYDFSFFHMTYLILRPDNWHISWISCFTSTSQYWLWKCIYFNFVSFRRFLWALNKLSLIYFASPVPAVISLKLILAVAPYFSYGCVWKKKWSQCTKM